MTGQPRGTKSSLSGRGLYPVRYSWLLTLGLRRLILSPAELCRRIGLRPDERIVEVGCGPGYFSAALAAAVPAGRLTVVDLQPEMVKRATQRLERAGVRRVEAIVADAAALPVADASTDVVVLVTVLGEIADRSRAIAEFRRILRRGGRLSITESWGDPDRLSDAALHSELGAAGFDFERAAGGRLARTTIWRRR